MRLPPLVWMWMAYCRVCVAQGESSNVVAVVKDQQQQRILQSSVPTTAPSLVSNGLTISPTILGSIAVGGTPAPSVLGSTATGGTTPAPTILGAITPSHVVAPKTTAATLNQTSSNSTEGKNISAVSHQNSTTPAATKEPNATTPTSSSSSSSTGGAEASSEPSMAPTGDISSHHHTTPSAPSHAPLAPTKPTRPISAPSSSSVSHPTTPTNLAPTLKPASSSGFGDDYLDQPTIQYSEKPVAYVPKDDDPVKSEETSPATEWQEQQETNQQLLQDKRLLIAFGTLLGVSFIILVLTAQQLLENPHGCCATYVITSFCCGLMLRSCCSLAHPVYCLLFFITVYVE